MAKPKLILQGLPEHEDVRQKHCVIPISLGQRYHTGVFFEGTIKLLAEKFETITIVVADILQRHTRKIYNSSLTENEIKEQLKSESISWIEKLKFTVEKCKLYEKTTIKVKVWDDFLNHPSFICILENLSNSCYLEDGSLSVFGQDVKNSINTYLVDRAEAFKESRKAQSNPFLMEEAQELSRKYVLEESAVVSIWKNEGDFDFIAYPRPLNASIINVIKTPANSKMLQFLEITDVKKLKNSQVISFHHKKENLVNKVPNKKNQKVPVFQSSQKMEPIELVSFSDSTFRLQFTSPSIPRSSIPIKKSNSSDFQQNYEYMQDALTSFRMSMRVILNNPALRNFNIKAELMTILSEFFEDEIELKTFDDRKVGDLTFP